MIGKLKKPKPANDLAYLEANLICFCCCSVERLPVQLTVNPVLDFLHEITVERARKEDSEVDLSRLRIPYVHFDRAQDALDGLLKIF